jgi:N-acetylglutamate synthase-like GNAT family acetyltransferase
MIISSFNYPFQGSSESHTSGITTCQIEKKKNKKLLKKTTAVWKKLALKRKHNAPYSTKETLDDSHFINGLVKKELKKLSKGVTLYVAQDAHKQVQGIALATIRKDCNWLEFLVTNPQNIPIHPYESAMRGVGTKLVAHVARDILQGKKHRCKKLHLWARPTAVGFYQKLGFETPYLHTNTETTYMVLKRKALRALAAKALPCKEKTLSS